MRNVFIFVDGLPFDQISNSEFLSTAQLKIRVVPGLGFSANLYPLLFCGLYPDDLGFFNVFNLVSPPRGKTLLQKLVRPFDLLRGIPLLSVISHRALKPLIGWTANIPFKYLHFFQFRACPPLDRELHSVFKDDQAVLIPERIFSPRLRDTQVIQTAIEVLRSPISFRNMFLFLFEPDHISHAHGVGSAEFDAQLRFLDMAVKSIADALLNSVGVDHSNVIVFSDHGMSNATTRINFRPERHLGEASMQSYVYFLDSVMARFWTFESGVLQDILALLRELPFGEILPPRDRVRFRVKDKAFGDIIFLLREGFAFVPNFFGWRLMKAYHGYHPDLPSQAATLLAWGQAREASLVPERQVFTSFDVYKFITSLLRRPKE